MKPLCILFSAALALILISCKKTTSTVTDNATPLVLNAIESKFIGAWTKDSIRIIGTSTSTTSVYYSGMKSIFKAEVYCPYCTTPTGAFKGSEEITTGNFSDFVWSSKKQDTLMSGSYYGSMAPQKIYQLTASKMVLIYKGYFGDSCVAYYHK